MRATGRAKRPYERYPLSWDFAADLARIPGDTVANIAMSVTDSAGVDVSATQLDTVALVASSVLQGWIKAGAAGTVYIVKFQIVTTAGAKWEHDVLVRVWDNA